MNRNDGSVTIRLPRRDLAQLRRRAREGGLTLSQALRELVAHELERGTTAHRETLFDRARRFVGCVESKAVPTGRHAREALAAWSSDRRG
jgi:hypothetical protein